MNEKFNRLKEAEISTSTFSFYTSVASVFSSKIEGENIELDSYIKYKAMGMAFEPDYTKKTDDLYNAYYFAQNHNLNEQSLASANALLANNTVQNDKLGKLRTQQMYVTTNDGRIEYVAESIFYLKSEMEKWCHDLAVLLSQDMNITEVFYYASYLYHHSI